MNIVVCDDEIFMREMLASKIRSILSDACLELYSSGAQLLEQCKDPDILFLDIGLPDLDGMETARRFRKLHERCLIVFVTAMEEYVYEAFDVGAFHYLVKPFSDEKFTEVFNRAVKRVLADTAKEAAKEADKPSIMIQTGGSHFRLFLEDIVYAEVFNRKIAVHKTDGIVEYYGRLSDLEKMAGEDFFRPHRAYLVHMKYITQYDATGILLGTERVNLSKAKYPEFVKAFMQYHIRSKVISP